MLTPRFKHDCGHCQLVGLTSQDDVYWCSVDQSLVLRYQDDHGDFACFPLTVAHHVAQNVLTSDRARRWAAAVALFNVSGLKEEEHA